MDKAIQKTSRLDAVLNSYGDIIAESFKTINSIEATCEALHLMHRDEMVGSDAGNSDRIPSKIEILENMVNASRSLLVRLQKIETHLKEIV